MVVNLTDNSADTAANNNTPGTKWVESTKLSHLWTNWEEIVILPRVNRTIFSLNKKSMRSRMNGKAYTMSLRMA